jgi:hypothetical protein
MFSSIANQYCIFTYDLSLQGSSTSMHCAVAATQQFTGLGGRFLLHEQIAVANDSMDGIVCVYPLSSQTILVLEVKTCPWPQALMTWNRYLLMQFLWKENVKTKYCSICRKENLIKCHLFCG